MKPTKVIQSLEGVVFHRFSMESLAVHLQNEFDLEKHLVIEDVTDNKDECDTSDYNLMTCLDAHGIFCDIDIYFLKLRKPDYYNNTIYVTGVGYEFQ